MDCASKLKKIKTMKPKNFPERKKAKRKEAEERVVEWRKMTPKQQLQNLDARLGENVGAKRQRVKINETFLI